MGTEEVNLVVTKVNLVITKAEIRKLHAGKTETWTVILDGRPVQIELARDDHR